MDVFAEIQGASRDPELLPARQRREVVQLATEILAVADRCPDKIDPVLVLICREFGKMPRKDWAGQIRACYVKHVPLGIQNWDDGADKKAVRHPPERRLAFESVEDLAALLDRMYVPLNIRIELYPSQSRTFYWALSSDVNWRWRATWRRVTTARFYNSTNCVWGSLDQEWDVKRVDWDEVCRNDVLRWKPMPVFSHDAGGGGGDYADILVTERRSA